MSLLIDGYNLLHATDLFGSGSERSVLEGSREALLAFLVARLNASERRRTTIVFDAAAAPTGLPDSYFREGVSVRFARGYPDADSMLEDLIEQWPGPRGLTVVSSDHRVQRAARSRGAGYIDSDRWFADFRRRESLPAEEEKPPPSGDVGGADFWVERFTDQQLLDEIEQSRDADQERTTPDAPSPRKEPQEPVFGEGIFPPGYAEDLAADFESEEEDPGPDS